jgi:hypothetical protein
MILEGNAAILFILSLEGPAFSGPSSTISISPCTSTKAPISFLSKHKGSGSLLPLMNLLQGVWA